MTLHRTCSSMLNHLSSHSRYLEYVVAYFESRIAILNRVVQYLNSLAQEVGLVGL